MSRRIDLELTSARPDGSWTWRAAGAREPKGVLDGALLPQGAKVGDVLRAEAEFDLDGITVLQVAAGKGARKEAERLEVIGTGRPFEPVTQVLAPGRPRGDRDRDRGDRGDRPRRPRPEGDRGPRPGGDRPGGDRPRGPRGPRPDGAADGDRGPRRDRPARPPRPPVPELPTRPKPKRLRPGRAHRSTLLASLPDDHKVIAEQVLRGGVPAVRQALQEQNTQLRAAGQPEIKPAGLLALAEELLPKVRVAEWLDRAEAATAELDELDLRDLRSVVAAGGDPVVARDPSTHELAQQLKDGLARRQDAEHEQWLGDMVAALEVGRLVRALRLSSRPPKAGVRFPPELGTRLSDATVAALGPDASGERWVAVLDALAYSPVRSTVRVTAPANPGDDVKAAVARLAGLLPDIATAFGITPPPAGARGPRPPRPSRPPAGKPGASGRAVPPPPAPTPAPAAEAVSVETPAEPVAPEAAAEVETTAPEAPVEVETAAPVEAAVEVEAAPPVEAAVEAPVEAETSVAEAAAEPGAPTVPEAAAADEAPGSD